MEKLIIGSRSSQLAMWQANFIKSELERKFPGLTVKIKNVKTSGDKIQDVALSRFDSKGVFTKEIEDELLAGNIDIAVHSLKDLQTELPPGLILGAVTERHAVEDVLVARKKNIRIEELREGGTVATGSTRRKAQLKHLRPDLNFEELRGNVNTRLRKFKESNWEAILMARAGLERIGLEENISTILDPIEFVPAVGQGILGIEVAQSNTDAIKLISGLTHEPSWKAALAERALLRGLGGGCHTPIAAYSRFENSEFVMDALVCSPDGSPYFRRQTKSDGSIPEKIGKELAQELLDMGAGDIL